MYRVSNFAEGRLATGISNASDRIVLMDGHTLPTTGTLILVLWNPYIAVGPANDPNVEIVSAGYSSGNTFLITRAQESTIAAAHPAGCRVGAYLTAGVIAQIQALGVSMDGAIFYNLAGIPSGAGVIPLVNIPGLGKTVYATAGTFSWTAPVGVTKIWVTMCGGGGGGAGAPSSNRGGGGGAGAESMIRAAYGVSSGGSYTVVVGSAGAGGARLSDGGNGVASSFDSNLSVLGGGGGKVGVLSGGTNGDGGNPPDANVINAAGNTVGVARLGGERYSFAGGCGARAGTTAGGGGGGSLFGTGGDGGTDYNVEDNTTGTGFGAGGGGASIGNADPYAIGKDGSSGFVMIEW